MPNAPTPATSLAAHVTVTAWCRACGHARPLDLAALAHRGHGDTPLLALPLACERCGSAAFGVTVCGARAPGK